MHLSSRQNKNRTDKTYDSKSINNGKDQVIVVGIQNILPISKTTSGARAKTRLDSQLLTSLRLCFYY
jgi:hypothetical protein